APEFAAAIERSADSRSDPELLRARYDAAAAQGYEGKFRSVVEYLDHLPKRAGCHRSSLLVLFDPANVRGRGARARLEALRQASRHDIRFAVATGIGAWEDDLSGFGAVVIHTSVRFGSRRGLWPPCRDALGRYPGLKILLVEDAAEDPDAVARLVGEL